jgi:hypothetical protein
VVTLQIRGTGFKLTEHVLEGLEHVLEPLKLVLTCSRMGSRVTAEPNRTCSGMFRHVPGHKRSEFHKTCSTDSDATFILGQNHDISRTCVAKYRVMRVPDVCCIGRTCSKVDAVAGIHLGVLVEYVLQRDLLNLKLNYCGILTLSLYC